MDEECNLNSLFLLGFHRPVYIFIQILIEFSFLKAKFTLTTVRYSAIEFLACELSFLAASSTTQQWTPRLPE